MLSQDLTRYVDLHRSVGFKFRIQHSVLRNFVAFAEAQGDQFVRATRVLDWAARAPSPPQRRGRLLTVRRFALALQAEDIRHEVPAADALGRGMFERRTPHIYRADEVTRLMRAAAQLEPADSIKPLMYSTLLGLLAATGMRISEALALRLEDVTADGLIVRQTKFHKSRLVPLHDTTRRRLDEYLSVRVRLGVLEGALFASSLHRRRRPAPTWISTRPRGSEASNIWSTIYANRTVCDGSYLAGQLAPTRRGQRTYSISAGSAASRALSQSPREIQIGREPL